MDGESRWRLARRLAIEAGDRVRNKTKHGIFQERESRKARKQNPKVLRSSIKKKEGDTCKLAFFSLEEKFLSYYEMLLYCFKWKSDRSQKIVLLQGQQIFTSAGSNMRQMSP